MDYFWQNWRNNLVVKRAKSLFVVSRPWKFHDLIYWTGGFSFNEGGNWLILVILWPHDTREKWFLYLAIGHYRVGFLRWSYHGGK